MAEEKGFSAAARRLKLLKGGHLDGDTVVDLLLTEHGGGTARHRFPASHDLHQCGTGE